MAITNFDRHSMYDPNKHKLKVRAAAAERGLGSYMNDTKWRELLIEIGKLPFPPPYQRKDILHAEAEPCTFDADLWCWGDYIEGILPLFSIEWIRIRPRYLKHVGQLVPNVVVDCEAQLEAALQALGQLYVKADDSIWIYGYK
jgi:hypothetical protein